ncbi:MAG: glycoside hydrolase family 3 C-terminal domain-containing protein, partial [Acidimicrobiia bacterium]|nr:glycoside hydrolase family 3 C-terminal domain-containing protein [Acidimicrobiia bacterium]
MGGLGSLRVVRRPVAWALAIAVVLAATVWGTTAHGVTAPTEGQWVDSTLSKMTLAEKVGQLFVVNAFGFSVRDPSSQAIAANQNAYKLNNFAEVVAKYHLGGIFYFGSNYQNPAQLVGLSNGIQQVEMSQRVPVPALITTDQEGGTVQVIGSPAALFPGNMGLGATGDPALAGQTAAVMGQEMRAMGVDSGLGPVVDVNTNPLNQADGARSFSDRTNVVQSFTTQQVLGLQQNPTTGVAAAAKHFPGLGSVTNNTDVQPGTSDRTMAQLQAIDLPAFAAAIQAGTKSIMTNFATYPNFDSSGLPAALSPTIVRGLLRNQLNFNGVVITDALQAGAITALNKTPAEIAVLAIKAGNDQLLELAEGPPADLDAAYNGVLKAVRSGDIPESRIDNSVRRILHEKWWLGLVQSPFQDPNQVPNIVGTPQHLALAQQASQKSMTLLKNQNGLLPLAARPNKKVFVTGWQVTGLPSVDTVTQAIAAKGPQTTEFPTGFAPNQTTINQAVAKSAGNDVIVALVYNVWQPQFNSPQENLVKALVGTGKPVVVIAQGTPYDAVYLPGIAAFLNAWNYHSTSLITAA